MTLDAKEKSAASGEPKECYWFVQGVSEWLQTSSDTAQTVGGRTYYPETVSRSAIDQSQETQAGGIDIVMDRTNPIASLFVSYLPATPVSVTMFRFHRGDSDVGTGFVGTVASAAFNGSQVTLRCLPISEALRRKIPTVGHESQCSRALYSNACGVNRNSYKMSAALSSVSGVTLQSSDLLAKPSGYFTTGYAESLSGETRFILSHASNIIVLMAPFTGVSASDVITVYAGCDRSETTCAAKFGNLVNHLGFPRVPSKNLFDGGIP